MQIVFYCKIMRRLPFDLATCSSNLPLNFSSFGIIKRITCFSGLELCFETQTGYIFSFLAYKTLRVILTLFLSNFFQLSFSDEKFIPSYLYLFIKGLIFVLLSACFPISSWFNATITTYWKHLLSFLLTIFIVVFLIFI